MGPARAHHVAWALREIAVKLLLNAPYSDADKLALMRDTSDTLLRAGRGQDLDITGALLDIEASCRALTERSGELVAATCRWGAWAAGASETQVARLSRFGFHLGTGMQLVEDVETMDGLFVATGAREFVLWAAQRERAAALAELEHFPNHGGEVLGRFCDAPFPALSTRTSEPRFDAGEKAGSSGSA